MKGGRERIDPHTKISTCSEENDGRHHQMSAKAIQTLTNRRQTSRKKGEGQKLM